MQGSASVDFLNVVCQLSSPASWRRDNWILVETGHHVVSTANLSMIAGELFNIQSIPGIVVTWLSSVRTSLNLYKPRQVHHTSSSPNKGSISLYTFPFSRSLLSYFVLSLVSGSSSHSSSASIFWRFDILGGLKVTTYFIIIFYLIGFYCQIIISNRFLLPNYIIYFYLLNHLF